MRIEDGIQNPEARSQKTDGRRQAESGERKAGTGIRKLNPTTETQRGAAGSEVEQLKALAA